jgi:hypothetical protein
MTVHNMIKRLHYQLWQYKKNKCTK